MNNIRLCFCFPEGKKNEDGLSPSVSWPIDELGLTYEQAFNVTMELRRHKTIGAWLASYPESPATNNSLENE